MKITKRQLKDMICEELNNSSILLEMPQPPIVGQEQTGDYTKEPEEYEGELAKRSLYHMGRQAEDLQVLIMNDEKLDPEVQANITKAADYLRSAFEIIKFDKERPDGR